ncbi:hypothetical protein HJFPF1_11835 [Paramyrothecium foliicola]|nr:hypothetical protein HJFPF1_11835 [Paramyrothecium foliicola]
MSTNPPDSAELAAAMAALRSFNVEAFTLLAIALAITGIRSYARIASVGFKNLWADDYLVVLAAVFYSAETALAYMVGNKAHGLANNSMTDEQRSALSPDSPEYHIRVLGSKIQLAGWTSYSVLLWLLKASLCTFYFRLTKDLDGYRLRIYFGFAFIAISWLVVMLNLLLSCQPFHHMWKISPDPGIYCQPAISPALIWTYLSFNVATDVYLIAIPIPMLFKAAMPLWKRMWLIALFSCGLFVTMAAILRVVLLVSDPVNGAQLAGSWAVRETFVAVVTTNLPVLFPHLKTWVSPVISIIGSRISTAGRSGGESTAPTSLDTWRAKSKRSTRTKSENATTTAPNNESEEQMVDEVALEDVTRNTSAHQDYRRSCSSELDPIQIQRQIEVSVLAEGSVPQDRRRSAPTGNYTNTWSGDIKDATSPRRSEYFGDHIHQASYNAGR